MARVQARHFIRNPASCRVMEKIGVAIEGRLPDPFFKWGKPEIVEMHAILKKDYKP